MWKNEISDDISKQDWGYIMFEARNLNKFIWENNFKIQHQRHITPSHKCFQECKIYCRLAMWMHLATFGHVWWKCSLISLFWSKIQKETQKMLWFKIPFKPNLFFSCMILERPNLLYNVQFWSHISSVIGCFLIDLRFREVP